MICVLTVIMWIRGENKWEGGVNMKIKLIKEDYILDQFEIQEESITKIYEVLRKQYIGRIISYDDEELTFRVFKEVE